MKNFLVFFSLLVAFCLSLVICLTNRDAAYEEGYSDGYSDGIDEAADSMEFEERFHDGYEVGYDDGFWDGQHDWENILGITWDAEDYAESSCGRNPEDAGYIVNEFLYCSEMEASYEDLKQAVESLYWFYYYFAHSVYEY